MEIIFDKKGKAIETILSKEEQLALLKENNKRAREFIVGQMIQQNQEMGFYGNKENTTTSGVS